SQKTE
ncbi:hypothetical protein A2U01_0107816, partial [Trifolium medium]